MPTQTASTRSEIAVEPGQRGFYFNAARCIGCKTCEFSCRDYHDMDAGHTYRRVIEYEGGAWIPDEAGVIKPHLYAYFISLACNHCDNPACMKVCPTGALVKEEDTGIVTVCAEKCTACGACTKACPYSEPCIDGHAHVARKCDGCLDRVRAGMNPVCVDACPMRALEFGRVVDIVSETKKADLAPLPRADITSPNLYIKEPKGARVAVQIQNMMADYESAKTAEGSKDEAGYEDIDTHSDDHARAHGDAGLQDTAERLTGIITEDGHIGNKSELHVYQG